MKRGVTMKSLPIGSRTWIQSPALETKVHKLLNINISSKDSISLQLLGTLSRAKKREKKCNSLLCPGRFVVSFKYPPVASSCSELACFGFSKLLSTLAFSLSLRSTTHQTAPRTRCELWQEISSLLW